jgi:flagellar hook protein FlgE
MIGTIYIGHSGMNAYARSLNVISNNVANLNTPGFKYSEALFSQLLFQSTGSLAGERGAGVTASRDRTSLKQGVLRSTGNSLDVAIDGDGYFVLDRGGERLYTRVGQFEFDAEGMLVDSRSRARVMVKTDSGAITSFDIDDRRVFPPRATAKVSLSGTLARVGTASTFSLPQFTVIDSVGGARTLSATFTRQTDPLVWQVEVRDADGAVVGSGRVEFGADGTPKAGANNVAVTLAPAGIPSSSFELNMGEPGSFTGVTAPPAGTASQLQLQRQDGVAIGSLTGVDFDDDGRLRLTYSNGEKLDAATLLLARVASPDQLRSLGGEIFVSVGDPPQLGTARSAGLGRTAGGQIELSNVELTDQFTDLIIVQRGYQASSQMISVANEMLQQLLVLQDRR